MFGGSTNGRYLPGVGQRWMFGGSTNGRYLPGVGQRWMFGGSARPLVVRRVT